MLTADDIKLAECMGEACGRNDCCIVIDVRIHHVHGFQVRSTNSTCSTWKRVPKNHAGRTREIKLPEETIPTMKDLLPQGWRGDRDGVEADIRLEPKDG